MSYFDTAAVYGAGHSEKVLGRALKGRDALISTKFGPVSDYESRQVLGEDVSDAGIRASVERSLKNLGRDRLDLLFFHLNEFPAADAGPEEQSTEKKKGWLLFFHLNEFPAADAGPVFDTLSALREEGKIDAFGWSTDNPDSAAAFADRDGFVAIQHDMNIFRPARDLRSVTGPLGLLSVARQPLAMGLLSDATLRGERDFTASDIRKLGTVSLEPNQSVEVLGT